MKIIDPLCLGECSLYDYIAAAFQFCLVLFGVVLLLAILIGAVFGIICILSDIKDRIKAYFKQKEEKT